MNLSWVIPMGTSAMFQVWRDEELRGEKRVSRQQAVIPYNACLTALGGAVELTLASTLNGPCVTAPNLGIANFDKHE